MFMRAKIKFSVEQFKIRELGELKQSCPSIETTKRSLFCLISNPFLRFGRAMKELTMQSNPERKTKDAIEYR